MSAAAGAVLQAVGDLRRQPVLQHRHPVPAVLSAGPRGDALLRVSHVFVYLAGTIPATATGSSSGYGGRSMRPFAIALVLGLCAPRSVVVITTANRSRAVIVDVAARATCSRRPPPATPARSFDDLGTYHRAVTTQSPEAQRYFDQGLRLIYAFNHDEAPRSFAAAARSIRAARSASGASRWRSAPTTTCRCRRRSLAEAWRALQQAQGARPTPRRVEQALIAALAQALPRARRPPTTDQTGSRARPGLRRRDARGGAARSPTTTTCRCCSPSR